MFTGLKILSSVLLLVAFTIVAGVLLEPYFQNHFTTVASGLKMEALVFALLSAVITQAQIIKRGSSK